MDAVIQNHLAASAHSHILPTSPLDASPSCASSSTMSQDASSFSSPITPITPERTHRSNPSLALAEAASPPRPHRPNPTLAEAVLSPTSSRESDLSLGRVITREDVLDDAGGERLGRVVTREDVFTDEPVGKASSRREDEEEGDALGEEVLASICGKYKSLRGNASHDF